MWRYIVRRLLWVVVVLLIITAITYLIFFVMPPVDPAVAFAGKNPTPDQIAETKHIFGLDKPIPVQYALFVKHLFLGDQYGWPGPRRWSGCASASRSGSSRRSSGEASSTA